MKDSGSCSGNSICKNGDVTAVSWTRSRTTVGKYQSNVKMSEVTSLPWNVVTKMSLLICHQGAPAGGKGFSVAKKMKWETRVFTDSVEVRV